MYIYVVECVSKKENLRKSYYFSRKLLFYVKRIPLTSAMSINNVGPLPLFVIL